MDLDNPFVVLRVTLEIEAFEERGGGRAPDSVWTRIELWYPASGGSTAPLGDTDDFLGALRDGDVELRSACETVLTGTLVPEPSTSVLMGLGPDEPGGHPRTGPALPRVAGRAPAAFGTRGRMKFMAPRSCHSWVIGLVAALVASASHAQEVPDVLYRYTAFWTCGWLGETQEFYQAAQGQHQTAIEIHNPSGENFTLNFTVRMGTTNPDGPNLAGVDAVALSPGEVVIIDCIRIRDRIGKAIWDPITAKHTQNLYHSGFVILQSPVELDVVAMNSLSGQRKSREYGNGMEIHYIEPRVYNLAAPAPQPVGVLQLQLQRVREVLDDIRGALGRSDAE